MTFVIIAAALVIFGLWWAFGRSDGYNANPTPAPSPDPTPEPAPAPVGPIDNDGPLVHPVLNLSEPVAKPKRARKPKAAAETAAETPAPKKKAPAKPRKKKGE